MSHSRSISVKQLECQWTNFGQKTFKLEACLKSTRASEIDVQFADFLVIFPTVAGDVQ